MEEVATYRDWAGHSCYYDAYGGLRGEQSGAATGDRGAGSAGLRSLDLGLAGQGRVELLLLLLLLDLALQLLLGVNRGRRQGLHLGLERVCLSCWHKRRRWGWRLHSCEEKEKDIKELGSVRVQAFKPGEANRDDLSSSGLTCVTFHMQARIITYNIIKWF